MPAPAMTCAGVTPDLERHLERVRGRWLVAGLLTLAACGGGERRDAQPTARADTAWIVSPEGVGPVRIGMSAAEAVAALGVPRDIIRPDDCQYIGVRALRRNVDVMVERDTVVRVDVRDSTVATAAGARVGDSEARVRALYPSLRTMPHKYTSGGRYLIVTPGADTTRQLIFETDGQRVTTYRAGRLPQVAYVERCG
jgi:hypothetical protein